MLASTGVRVRQISTAWRCVEEMSHQRASERCTQFERDETPRACGERNAHVSFVDAIAMFVVRASVECAIQKVCLRFKRLSGLR